VYSQHGEDTGPHQEALLMHIKEDFDMGTHGGIFEVHVAITGFDTEGALGGDSRGGFLPLLGLLLGASVEAVRVV